jgi:lipid-A-disaccharide synthase
VLKTDWVSLPNIILQKTAVLELLQKDMTLKKVRNELENLLYNYNYREKIVTDYTRLKALMGDSGCSKRAAEKIVDFVTLNSKP